MNDELSDKLRGFERVWERVSGKDEKSTDAPPAAGDGKDANSEAQSPAGISRAVRFIAGCR